MATRFNIWLLQFNLNKAFSNKFKRIIPNIRGKANAYFFFFFFFKTSMGLVFTDLTVTVAVKS